MRLTQQPSEVLASYFPSYPPPALALWCRSLYFPEALAPGIWVSSANGRPFWKTGSREKPGRFSLSSCSLGSTFGSSCLFSWNALPSAAPASTRKPLWWSYPSPVLPAPGNAVFSQYHSSQTDGSSFLLSPVSGSPLYLLFGFLAPPSSAWPISCAVLNCLCLKYLRMDSTSLVGPLLKYDT